MWNIVCEKYWDNQQLISEPELQFKKQNQKSKHNLWTKIKLFNHSYRLNPVYKKIYEVIFFFGISVIIFYFLLIMVINVLTR